MDGKDKRKMNTIEKRRNSLAGKAVRGSLRSCLLLGAIALLLGLGIFGMIVSDPDKLEEFVNKGIAEAEEIKKIEDGEESLRKKREWLMFRAAPVLAFLGLPIASVLAIMRSNKMHIRAFDIAKDDLYDDPQLVIEALKARSCDLG
jgi:cell division septal protein FtsQ